MLQSKTFSLITLLFALWFSSSSQTYIQFIENKAQWPENVLYKSDLPSGSIFLEQNCMTYCMFSQCDVHKCEHISDYHGQCEDHDHEHELQAFGDVIQFYAFKKQFDNYNPNMQVISADKFPHYYNYFIGNDKSKWASRVNAYKVITYKDLYEDIDMVIYQHQQGYLKYDMIVYPGGDPDQISFTYEGLDNITVQKNKLIIDLDFMKIVEEEPIAYQIVEGDTVFVGCQYYLRNKKLSFKLNRYNEELPLIIDPPTLIFSTYSGSYSNNFGYTAAYDSKGNLYSGSSAFGPDYPTTTGAYQTSFGGDHTDMAITKWLADGSAIVYSTLIGGADDELPHSIIVNDYNEIYILGTTGSANYPSTAGVYDETFNYGTSFTPTGLGMDYTSGCDIVVTKLSNDGATLEASTFVGGTGNDGINIAPNLRNNYADEMRGEVLLDEDNNVYIVSCTNSDDFPVTSGAIQTTYGGGTQDGCVFKMDEALTTLLWSTYYGGSDDDAAYSVALDSNEDIYISGGTVSTNIPLAGTPLYDTNLGGDADGFIAHIHKDGGLLQSTYFGSNTADQCYFVEIDNEGYVYILGQTYAPGYTMVFNALYSVPSSGHFVSKVSPELDILEFSTVFGKGSGHPIISPTAFLVDYCNKMYISGWGGNTNALSYGGPGGNLVGFPVTTDAYQSTTDGSDFYILVLEDDASELVYATFMGGSTSSEHVDGGTSRFDRKGKVYEAVCAGCGYPAGYSDFPTTTGAWSNTNNSNCNLAVFKFDFNLPLVVADFDAPYDVCAPYTIDFENLSLNGDDFSWNFGDGSPTSTEFEPSHLYDTPGTYLVTLYVEDTTACNFGDSIQKYITVHEIDFEFDTDTFLCYGETVYLDAYTGNPDDEYWWSSNPSFSDMLNDAMDVSGFNASPSSNTNYFIQITNDACEYIDTVEVLVHRVDVETLNDTMICLGDTITLTASDLIGTDILTYDWSVAEYFISDSTSDVAVISPEEDITYTLLVENQYGCSETQDVEIEVSEVIVNLTHDDLICYHDNSGSITATPTSGETPFTYDWSNDDNTAVIYGLPAGTYTVTVTDNIGCDQIQSVTLTEPPYLNAFVSDTTSTQCDGLCSGTATLDVSGGTPSYTYNWIDGQTAETAIELCAATYYVTITDDNGCDTVLSVTITDPSDLVAAVADSSHAICYNDCNGTASVIVELGNPPYTYTWSNGDNDNATTGLCAGYHSVTIIDDDVCVRVVWVSILQPDSVWGEINETSSMVCSGDAVDLHVDGSGGTPGYTYEWLPPLSTTGQDVYNLGPGTYSVLITDENDCENVVPYTITDLEEIDYDSEITPVSCLEVCNGTIELEFNGGVPPFSYQWGGGMYGPEVSGLCFGNYPVTVTDSRGCEIELEFDVGVSPDGPPLEVTVDDQYLYLGQNTGLHATWDPDYSYFWTPATELDHPLDANPHTAPAGTTTFEVVVYDENGCSSSDTITVYVSDIICSDPYIYIPNAFTPNDDGINDVLYVYGDMLEEVYFAIFNRWGQIVFETDNVYEGWDGTYNGHDADPAVFDYYLKATCVGNETFEKKGNITLIR